MRQNRSRLMTCLSVVSLVASMFNSVGAAPSDPLSKRPSSVLPSSGLVPKNFRARAQRAPSSMMQMPMIFPLFIQNQDFASTLVLTNALNQPTYADVTLSRTDGREITHQRVQFAPHSQSTVDVQSLLMSAVSPATTGSITVMQSPEFDGTMVILGQLSMTYRASEQPNYIDEEIAMPNMEGSQTLRAVADPGEGSPLVAVTNLSEAGQHIAVRCFTQRDENFTKSVDLLAGETLLTEACSERTIHDAVIESFSPHESESRHSPVGISLTTDGMPGSIAAFGLQPHKKGHHHFFSNVTFTDPKMLMSPATVFDGVPAGPASLLSAGNYVPELSLTNFSAKALQVKVQYSQTSGTTPATKQLTAFSIAAGSSKKVTFDDIQGDPQLQNSFLVTSTGVPGDLLAKLVSKNDTAPDEVELLGKDAQDMNNGGSNPWSIVGSSDATLLFFNHDQAPQIFNVLITSQDGTQWNKDFSLAPMETRAISIGEVVRKEVKDDKGKTLPKTAVSGQISWWTVGTSSGPGTGRLLQSSRTSGMTRSFACGCPYILCGLTLIPDFSLSLLGGTDDPFISLVPIICLYQVGTHCNGKTTSNSSSQALQYSWSSSNGTVAQISGSSTSSSVGVYGAAIGTATMTGSVSATYFYPAETCTFTGGGPAPVISVVVHFVPPKDGNDLLSFTAYPNYQAECSESLGLIDCSSLTSTWHWNLEGRAVASDLASNWTVVQSVQYKQKGHYRDTNNNLQPFTCSNSVSPDGPNGGYFQQSQNTTYWIDGPGSSIYYNPSPVCGSAPTQSIDSQTIVFNFQVTYSHTNPAYSRTVYHYVKLVVASGGHLDTTNSVAAYGNISLNF